MLQSAVQHARAMYQDQRTADRELRRSILDERTSQLLSAQSAEERDTIVDKAPASVQYDLMRINQGLNSIGYQRDQLRRQQETNSVIQRMFDVPAADRFKMVSSFKVKRGSGPHWARPSIYRGKLYVRHGGVLLIYNLKA